jgi:DNA-binding CsgD family transcriptional regulator
LKLRRWTLEEECYLEKFWGKYTLETLSKKLNRTVGAIQTKAHRKGLSGMYSTGEYLSGNEVAKTLNIDNHTVIDYWIPKCNLKHRRRKLHKSYVYQIKLADLINFLKNNQNLWDSNKVPLYALGVEPVWLKEKRRKDYRNPPGLNEWTETKEKELIKLYYKGIKIKDIATKIGRTYKAVTAKLYKLKKKGEIKSRRVNIAWTPEEDKILIEMDKENKQDKEIAYVLGRDKSHVHNRRMVLKKQGKYPTSKMKLVMLERIKEIKKLKSKGLNNKDIASRLNVCEHTVSRDLKRMEAL